MTAPPAVLPVPRPKTTKDYDQRTTEQAFQALERDLSEKHDKRGDLILDPGKEIVLTADNSSAQYGIGIDNSGYLRILDYSDGTIGRFSVAWSNVDGAAQEITNLTTYVDAADATLQASINTNMQAITDEEIARAQAIADEAAARAQALADEASARATEIAQEATDRANAITAEATQRAQDVLDLEQADIGLGDRLTTLETTVDTPTTGLSAKIATLESTTADLEANKAEASVVTAIQSDLDDPTTGLKARATSLEDRTTAVENGKAEASVVSGILTDLDDPTTGLKSRATALEGQTTALEADKAEASDLAVVQAEINNPTTGLKARATAVEDRVTVVENGKADTSVTDLLDTEINDPTTGLKTRATSLENRATTLENGKAEATDLSALTTRVDDAETAIVDEQIARSAADSAFTQSLNTQIARIDGAEGDIASLDTAIANETGVRVSQINTLGARLEARSMNAGQLLPNWNFKEIDDEGKPAGIQPVEGTAARDELVALATGMRITSNADTTVAFGFPAVPIDDQIQYTVIVRHASSATSTQGLFLRFNELAGSLMSGDTHVNLGGSAIATARTSFKDLISNGPMPGPGVTQVEYTYTPTPGTKFASFSMYNWSGFTGSYDVESVQIIPTAANIAADVVAVDTRVTDVTQLIADETQARVDDISDLSAKFSASPAAQGTINQNPYFRDDPIGSTSVPSEWVNAGGTAGNILIVEHPEYPGLPCLQMTKPAGLGLQYIFSPDKSVTGGETLKVRARVSLVASSTGGWGGAGVFLQQRRDNGGFLGNPPAFAFGSDPDVLGNVNSSPVLGKEYVYETEVTLSAAAGLVRAFLTGNYGNYPGYSTTAEYTIRWHELSIERVSALSGRVTNAQADATSALSLVATEESSRISEVSRLDAQFRSDVNSQNLVKNSKFSMDPEGYVGLPRGWSEWGGGALTEIRQSTFDADRLVAYMDAPAGTANRGFFQLIYDVVPGQAYTLTATVRRRGGSFESAGVHSNFRSSSGAQVGTNNLDFDADASLDGQTGAYKDGTVTFSKTIVAPAGTVDLRLFAMAAWGGFGSNATGVQIDWYEVSVTPVDASVQTGIDAKATADSNSQLIASETAARASQFSEVEARFTQNEVYKNEHPFALFEEGWEEAYEPGWDGNSGIAAQRGVNLDPNGAWGGLGGFNVHYTYHPGSPAAGTVTQAASIKNAYKIPCQPNQWVFGAFYCALHRLSAAEVIFDFWDANMTYLTSAAAGYTTEPASVAGQFGNLSNFRRVYGWVQVPANARYLNMTPRGHFSGEANPYMFTTGYQVTFVDTDDPRTTPVPFVAADAVAGASKANAQFLKDALATGTSSQARLFMGVNTANNEAFIEQYAGEGDGVWNGSKIKFTADKFEFNGDVIVNGTITADNIAPGSLTNFAFTEPADTGVGTDWTDVATLSLTSAGIGVELRASCQLYASAIPPGSFGGTGYVRLLRNSTVLREKEAIFSMTNTSTDPLVPYYEGSLDFVLDKNDLPSAGTYTYKLQAKMPGNTATISTSAAKAPYLSAREQLR